MDKEVGKSAGEEASKVPGNYTGHGDRRDRAQSECVIGAGLLARKAAARGLETVGEDPRSHRRKSSANISTSPACKGSRQAPRLQSRRLRLHDLEVGLTRLGNSKAINDNDLVAAAVLGKPQPKDSSPTISLRRRSSYLMRLPARSISRRTAWCRSRRARKFS